MEMLCAAAVIPKKMRMTAMPPSLRFSKGPLV
jgi:hypothetical protein